MPAALVISVRFHQGRYHGLDNSGRPEWPPSPARIFQALLVASVEGTALLAQDQNALRWLEQLDPPVIAAPAARRGQYFKHFVPNNDLDTVGGDPGRIAEIRTAIKIFHPRLFNREIPFLYVWQFDDIGNQAGRICYMAEQIYQVGRGVDVAWASGEILRPAEADARLAAHAGVLHRPSGTGDGHPLACPEPGSLASLVQRQVEASTRFALAQTLSQPRRPLFAMRSYDSPTVRLIYELRQSIAEADFAAQRITDAVRLVEWARDDAEKRLSTVLPDKADVVARVFIGRNATEADKASRIRIVPLPSIGHAHADRAIRRLLVEIPPDCPLRPDDINWAFSSLPAIDNTTGEILWTLAPAEDAGMLDHYGVGEAARHGFRRWRTVTPTALPEQAARRRVDPRSHEPAEQKDAAERIHEECRATAAVRQALRHAGITTKAECIRVQREPFDTNGTRAEAFAHGSRFASRRLWHAEITFSSPISGPIVIGDGRYLGLGLMAPVDAPRSIHAFTISARVAASDAEPLVRALRRAVMARVRETMGRRPNEGLPRFFCGHEPDGSPAAAEIHQHLFFATAGGSPTRLLVMAPHSVMRREPTRSEVGHLHVLDAALSGLRRLVAGRAGAHELTPLPELPAGDRLLGPARIWQSCTYYQPTRHPRRSDAGMAVVQDVVAEVERRRLPRPEVELLELTIGPNGGDPSAQLRLRFDVAVQGPVLLGRNSHLGGGLFAAADDGRAV